MEMHGGNVVKFGYLTHCYMTGAWRGSVWAPRRSLPIRLPALVVWLSRGLRRSGRRPRTLLI
jgi:hypothetical protein